MGITVIGHTSGIAFMARKMKWLLSCHVMSCQPDFLDLHLFIRGQYMLHDGVTHC